MGPFRFGRGGDTDSLELTNQGSFPLVWGVFPILYLKKIFFLPVTRFRFRNQNHSPPFWGGSGGLASEAGYFRPGVRARSSRWVGKNTAFPLHPYFKPPDQPWHPAPPPACTSLALLPSPAPPPSPPPPRPLLRARLPFPAYSGTPSCFFIFPNWRPTPAAPQCAPHPVQQILRKARPALAQPQPPGGGRGRPGASPAPPALPV